MKVGVIGTGRFGQLHLQKYSSMREVKLVGIYESDILKSHKIASQYKCRAFDDLQDFFNEVDAVSICTPSVTHFEFASKAIKANKHTFIEKPMCITSDEARSIIRLVLDTNLVILVGHIERFNEALKRAERNIDPLDITEISAVRTCVHNGRCRDSGVVHDLMIHDIDIALKYAPGTVQRVEATGEKYYDDGFDKVEAHVLTTAGCKINLTANRNSLIDERLMTIHSGSKVININFHQKRNDALYEELRDFINTILGKRPRGSQVWDGAAAVQLAEDINKLIKGD